jgi:hypothetical protein
MRLSVGTEIFTIYPMRNREPGRLGVPISSMGRARSHSNRGNEVVARVFCLPALRHAVLRRHSRAKSHETAPNAIRHVGDRIYRA